MTLILAILLVGADFIAAPPKIPTDSGSIVVSGNKEGIRWNAAWTMSPAEVQGKRAVHFTEQGQGRQSQFPQQVRWSLESTWLAEDTFRFVSSEKTVTALSGDPVVVERKQFDSARGT